MYKLDDFRPYLYKTTDYGKTWTKIVAGIPDRCFTRVVREDPVRRGLLYAGTEFGLYVSFDDGATLAAVPAEPARRRRSRTWRSRTATSSSRRRAARSGCSTT